MTILTTDQFFNEFSVDYPDLAQCYSIYDQQDEYTYLDDLDPITLIGDSY